jgi:Mn-dependent DtxR family transcriptional regulator
MGAPIKQPWERKTLFGGRSRREGGTRALKLFRSGENYLKTILILQKQKGAVRSLDVADHLHVSRASVCRAVKLLQEGGFLTMDREKRLHLTRLGKSIAGAVYEKHSVLFEALLAIGVTPETADRDACELEHAISQETFDCVKALLSRRDGAQDPA